MGLDWLDTVISVVYRRGLGVDLLDSVTSVVYLGAWGLTGLTESFQSFIWVVWG